MWRNLIPVAEAAMDKCSGVDRLRWRQWAAAVVGLLLCLFAICLLPAHLAAATVVVNVNTDTTGTCSAMGVATCSLRDAIAFANLNDSTTITFQAGLVSPILLTGPTLTLTRVTGTGTTITGPGAASLAVDG